MNIRNIYCCLAIIIFVATQLCAQNTNPIVSNITLIDNRTTTGKVDIYYDVSDAEQSSVSISVKVIYFSSSAGYELPLDDFMTWCHVCSKITGDAGTNIATGVNKHIIWDFAAEPIINKEEIPDYKIMIVANDEVAGGNPCTGISSINYAGKTYYTVQIGEQCWLKENLDVGTMIIEEGELVQSQENNGIIEKFCYDNNPANCETYGGLYTWGEAMQYVTTQGTRGICPNGWHIPTYSEYQILLSKIDGNYNGANKLLEVGQGSGYASGTNTIGFSGLLGGWWTNYSMPLESSAGKFYQLGSVNIFWNSSRSPYGIYLILDGMDNYSKQQGFFDELYNYGYSVRCIKD